MAKRLKDSTQLTILQLPLINEQEPTTELTQSQGRFIAEQKDFLDPATVPPGSRVTLVGELSGSIPQSLDETVYTYPTLIIKHLKAWPAYPSDYDRYGPYYRQSYLYPYPYAYPYWGPYSRFPYSPIGIGGSSRSSTGFFPAVDFTDLPDFSDIGFPPDIGANQKRLGFLDIPANLVGFGVDKKNGRSEASSHRRLTDPEVGFIMSDLVEVLGVRLGFLLEKELPLDVLR